MSSSLSYQFDRQGSEQICSSESHYQKVFEKEASQPHLMTQKQTNIKEEVMTNRDPIDSDPIEDISQYQFVKIKPGVDIDFMKMSSIKAGKPSYDNPNQKNIPKKRDHDETSNVVNKQAQEILETSQGRQGDFLIKDDQASRPYEDKGKIQSRINYHDGKLQNISMSLDSEIRRRLIGHQKLCCVEFEETFCDSMSEQEYVAEKRKKNLALAVKSFIAIIILVVCLILSPSYLLKDTSRSVVLIDTGSHILQSEKTVCSWDNFIMGKELCDELENQEKMEI